jgi:hypothetical protein
MQTGNNNECWFLLTFTTGKPRKFTFVNTFMKFVRAAAIHYATVNTKHQFNMLSVRNLSLNICLDYQIYLKFIIGNACIIDVF